MSAMINRVSALGSLAGMDPLQRAAVLAQAQGGEAAATGRAGESAFGSIFNSLIQNVKDTDADFVQAQYLLATGQLDNPAQIGITGYKYEVAVDLLVQMRNRALDAYNELKNMNI